MSEFQPLNVSCSGAWRLDRRAAQGPLQAGRDAGCRESDVCESTLETLLRWPYHHVQGTAERGGPPSSPGDL